MARFIPPTTVPNYEFTCRVVREVDTGFYRWEITNLFPYETTAQGVAKTETGALKQIANAISNYENHKQDILDWNKANKPSNTV